MKERRQATGPQVEQRIEEILRIRLDGAERIDVIAYVRELEKEPGNLWTSDTPLSKGQISRYIGWADRAIIDSTKTSRRRRLRHHIAKRGNLYAKAVSQGDIRTALAILADEAALLGLYPEKKTALDITGKIKNDHTVTVTIEQKLSEFRDRYGAENVPALVGADRCTQSLDPSPTEPPADTVS
jgi:hypothetical protein